VARRIADVANDGDLNHSFMLVFGLATRFYASPRTPNRIGSRDFLRLLKIEISEG
jgi:hypothetical protein